MAQLDDSDDRIRLERASTDLAIAHRQLAEAEEKRDWAAAGQARLNMDLHQAEVTLYQEKVEKSHLRASIRRRRGDSQGGRENWQTAQGGRRFL